MKNYIAIFCLFVLTFVFSSCTLNKTPISAKEFSSKLEEKGFTIIDVTEEQEGKTITTLLAVDASRNYQIEFYEFSTQAQASGVFSTNSTNIDQIGSGSSSSASGSNWAFRAKTAGGAYAFVSYIGTTFVYVRAPDKYKQEIRNAIKELGY